MTQQYNRPAPTRTLINNNVFNLSAPCPTAEGKWSKLSLHATNTGMSITVWTQDPNDANNQGGKITFQCPLVLVSLIVRAIEDVVRGKYKERSFRHEDFSWGAGGKRSDKKVLISTLIVGKDDNGVFISVRSFKNDRPRINFYFGSMLSRSYQIVDENNQVVPAAELSKEASLAWATSLAKVLHHIVTTNYKHPEAPANGGNRQGGYSGGGNGGNGGGSAPAASSGSTGSDDLSEEDSFY